MFESMFLLFSHETIQHYKNEYFVRAQFCVLVHGSSPPGDGLGSSGVVGVAVPRVVAAHLVP